MNTALFASILVLYTVKCVSLNMWDLAGSGGKYPNATKQKISEVDENIVSYHQCSNSMHTDIDSKRCRISNICSYRGHMYYFAPPESTKQNRNAAIFWQHDGKRITLKDNQTALFCTDTECGTNLFKPFLIKDTLPSFAASLGVDEVQWHQRPVYMLTKQACTNGGHCLMQSLGPLVVNMLLWGINAAGRYDVFDNDILLLETPAAMCGCESNLEACGGEGTHPRYIKLCNQFVQNFLGSATRNTVLYLDHLESATKPVMDCWRQGFGGTGLSSPYKNEHQQMESLGYFFAQMRDLLYYRHGVVRKSYEERLKELVCRAGESTPTIRLNVLFGKKDGKRSIANIDEVANWTSAHQFHAVGLPPISRSFCGAFKLKATKRSNSSEPHIDAPGSILPPPAAADGSHTAFTVEFETSTVLWEQIERFSDQLQLLSDSDILVATPGSGAINALLMPDPSSVIHAPFCDIIDCEAFEGFVIHEHQSHYESFYYDIDHNTEITDSGVWANPHVVFRDKEKYLTILETATYSVLYRLFSVAA